MRPPSATSAAMPDSTCSPVSSSAAANSTSRVVRSILETRLHNGPKVAELAAERRRPELAGLLDDALDTLVGEDDPVERQRHALTFWDHIVDGADSIAFRLMYNTLRATYEPALPALAAVMADEVGRPRGVPPSR